MATVNQKFHSAPMGRRVVGTVIFAFAIVSVFIGARVAVSLEGFPAHALSGSRIAGDLAPLLVPLIVVAAFLHERARVAEFRIEENCLVLGAKRFPLEGLVGVARDAEVLHRAIKVWGNGGLGSIRGSFRSKRVGKFYAFMTDAEKAVVLRWPDKAVAVSPMDPEFFILSVRSAAGLR